MGQGVSALGHQEKEIEKDVEEVELPCFVPLKFKKYFKDWVD